MAKTKQTARKSTGGLAPQSHYSGSLAITDHASEAVAVLEKVKAARVRKSEVKAERARKSERDSLNTAAIEYVSQADITAEDKYKLADFMSNSSVGSRFQKFANKYGAQTVAEFAYHVIANDHQDKHAAVKKDSGKHKVITKEQYEREGQASATVLVTHPQAGQSQAKPSQISPFTPPYIEEETQDTTPNLPSMRHDAVPASTGQPTIHPERLGFFGRPGHSFTPSTRVSSSVPSVGLPPHRVPSFATTLANTTSMIPNERKHRDSTQKHF